MLKNRKRIRNLQTTLFKRREFAFESYVTALVGFGFLSGDR